MNKNLIILMLGCMLVFSSICDISLTKRVNLTQSEVECLHLELQELKEELAKDTIPVIDEHELHIARLACAFAKVESNNNPQVQSYGCIGWLQITPVCVKAANDIVGFDCFTLNDRWSVSESYAIFRVIMNEKNPEYDIKKACKIWNPTAGSSYYNKVRQAYNFVLSDITLDSLARSLL